MTELLVLLVITHLIGDFYLQKNSWVLDKEQRHFKSIGLIKHSGVHGLLAFTVLFTNSFSIVSIVFPVLIIASSHYVIDGIKSYVGHSTKAFIADQAAHLLIIFLTWMFITGTTFSHVIEVLNGAFNLKHLVIIMGYLIAFKPTSILMGLVLSKFINEQPNPPHGLKEAGQNIGYLERFLIITLVLLNQYSGVGFLLAAKSILRVGDLRESQDKRLTEYVLLGTLLSTSIALSIGWLLNKTFY